MSEPQIKVTLNISALDYLLSPEFEDKLDKVCEVISGRIAYDAEISIYEPKGGKRTPVSGTRIFRIKGQQVAYKPYTGANNNPRSSPGEAPANQTGQLAQSIKSVRKELWSWEVQVGAYYGFYLEFGTTKMAPRPFLGPASMKNVALFELALRVVFREIPEVR